MFGRFRRTSPDAGAIASALYGAIVAQARNPGLYAELSVPDTVEGRFEMVVLHLALVLRRLRSEAGGAGAGQGVFDLFCSDMDRSLREMGVGDLGVPKRMKKMGEAFYGRAAAYEAALESSDRAKLADALARNVYSGATDTAGALANYVAASASELERASGENLLRGTLPFPDAAKFAEARAA